MDRKDVAIVINTCPKYMYLLESHFGLLRRYGEACKWPVYLATEYPFTEKLQLLCMKYNIIYLPLEVKDADFLESRLAAMHALPPEIKYVLPLQEDFLIERPGLGIKDLESALTIFDSDKHVASLRLMPCPGSSEKVYYEKQSQWQILQSNDLLFSYQATLWRRPVYTTYINSILSHVKTYFSELLKNDEKPNKDIWNSYAITTNPAETYIGMSLIQTLYPSMIHLCYARKGAWANAVYMCPWPYRPTAVVRGVLEPWAQELIRREGFNLQMNAYAYKTS